MKNVRRSNYFLDEEEEVVVRNKKRKHNFFRVLITILVIAAIIGGFILLFHTRKINVTGNEYCSKAEVRKWIQKDTLSYNTLYTFWKYNYTDAEQLPLVDTMEITMKSPWEIDARVYEKSIIGYLDFSGTRVYFDKDGIVVSETKDVIDGVPMIDGITVNLKKVVVHEKLPTGDDKAFDNIFEVSLAVAENGVIADKIAIDDTNAVSIYIGNVVATLGTTGYADKVAQLPPVLEKLQENYPDKKGTLHLENYSKTHSYINFTPK